jgi:hypothetical protein
METDHNAGFKETALGCMAPTSGNTVQNKWFIISGKTESGNETIAKASFRPTLFFGGSGCAADRVANAKRDLIGGKSLIYIDNPCHSKQFDDPPWSADR